MEDNLIEWILQNYREFLLVLLRISIFVFIMPIFSVRNIPFLVKTIIAVSLTLFITGYYNIKFVNFPTKTYDYFLYLLIELFIGLTISLMLRSIFGGLQLASQIAGFQMGLSMANIIDPSTGTQSVVLTEFMYIIAILLFFATNAHHFLLLTILDSFNTINPGYIVMNPNILEIVLRSVKEMFVLSIKLMAPVIVILFFIQVAFGILARTSPQLNILIISFSINILVGLFFISLTLQVFWPTFAKYIHETIKTYPLIFRMFAS